METNNIDKIVSDLLDSRTIQPSNSAWERLSSQLDIAQEKKRKNWFILVGYAASILLVISVVFFMNTDDVVTPMHPEKIVTAPIIDTTKFVKPATENTISTETVIVKSDKVEVKQQQKNTGITKRNPQIKQEKIIVENPIVFANNTIYVKEEIKNQKQLNRIIVDSKSLLNSVDSITTKVAETNNKIPKKVKKGNQLNSIHIDADDLLYAVTHTAEEVKAYYAKYNVNREEVLKNIQKELIDKGLKINANILLTEVEKTIDEETFKKSFLQVVKGKITGLASAIANRNN